jgi:anti-anti-sigma factor
MTVEVRLEGEIDLASIGQVDAQLMSAEEAAADSLVLDLTAVTFIDSSGLRSILTAHERLESRGATLVVVKPPPHVFKLFELTGVDAILHCVDSPVSGEAAA